MRLGRTLAFVLVASAFAGCGAILGVDFDKAHPIAIEAGAGASDAASDVVAPSTFEVVSALPAGDELNSIWGVDDSVLFAVGSGGVRRELVAGDWLRTSNFPGRTYHQVWGLSDHDVYTVGEIDSTGKGVVEHFDGASWSEDYVAPTPLTSIWSDGTAVMAVGPKGYVYGRAAARSGEGWSQVTRFTTPSIPDFEAITGNARANVTYVGSTRVYHTTDVGDLQWYEPEGDLTLRFRSAWGAPGDLTDVLLGTNYLGVVWMYAPNKLPRGAYDASLLTPDASLDDLAMFRVIKDETDINAKDLFVRGVWGAGTKRFFVGDHGRVYAMDTLQGDLRTVPSGTTRSLHGVWASKQTLWVVGESELVMRAPLP
jgi:hypothetical protein